MKVWILAVVAALMAVGASAQNCECKTMKWATCTGTAPSCQCNIQVTKDKTQPIDCNALVSKCFLMKTEMLRRSKGQDTRSVGKPEEGFVDNDGIYDPDCENTGAFRAKQCNNTQECWCVNSAGVRRTEKEGADLKCEKLVETYWIRLILDHAPLQKSLDPKLLKDALGQAIQDRYQFNKMLVKEIEYDSDARKIQVDIKKDQNDTQTKLADMAYYMEREIKKTPLYFDQKKFAPMVGDQSLNLTNILVYYVDAEPPTFKMNRLAGGVIAAIVVVLLIVAAGLLLLVSSWYRPVYVEMMAFCLKLCCCLQFFWNRRNKKYRKTQQTEGEMENK